MQSCLAFASLLLLACGGAKSAAPDATAAPDAAPPAPDAAPPAPSLTLLDYGIAVDITPDGRTAVFEDISTPQATAFFFDTVAGTAGAPIVIGASDQDLATGISANGRLSAFHGDPVVAGMYTAAAGWTDVASPFTQGCDNQQGAGWDVSADGSVLIGMMWNGCAPQAFRWTDAGGTPVLTPLDILGAAQTGGTTTSNRATVVSDDGKVTAGFASRADVDRSAAVWTADGHGVLLDDTADGTPSEVLSIDADGGVLAGVFGYDGFVWTKAGGMVTLVRLADALPSDPVYPSAMTADGAIVFGGVGDAFFSTPIAFAWTAQGGMRKLTDIAAAGGVTVPDGVLLNNVLGASTDGAVLIGTAMDAQGAPKTFVLRVPPAALQP